MSVAFDMFSIVRPALCHELIFDDRCNAGFKIRLTPRMSGDAGSVMVCRIGLGSFHTRDESESPES